MALPDPCRTILGNVERVVRRVPLLVAALALAVPATAQEAELAEKASMGWKLCRGWARVRVGDDGPVPGALAVEIDVLQPIEGIVACWRRLVPPLI